MRRSSFALLALLPIAAAAQNAKPRSAAELGLIEANGNLSAALANGDTTALAPMLAADLVYTDASGSALSRAQLLSAVAAGYRVRMSPAEVTRVHIDGNIGLLDFQSRVATAADDSVLVQSNAVYVLRAGRWQLTSLHSTGAPAPVRRSPQAPNTPTAMPVMPTPAVTAPHTTTPTPIRRMTAHAEGTFQVETKPLAPYNTSAGAGVGRFSIDKQYHGDIEGTGEGEMLSSGNPASGSAGYVAIERVTATIRGKTGSFSLQHSGTMEKGALSLSISVVPGSGTGDFAGIAGTMNITVENGKHSYLFDFSLPGGV